MKTRNLRVLLLPAAIVALLCLGLPAFAVEYAGSEACEQCHAEAAKNMNLSVHGGVKVRTGDASGCEACHGPGKAHADASGEQGGMVAFSAAESPSVRTEKCMQCHAERSGGFHYLGSDHMKGAVTCTDCHAAHGNAARDKLLPKNPAMLCLKCHQEMVSPISLNERHRVWEGVMSCIDCHDPHARSTRMALGGFDQEACFKCHTDLQGPFLYEHGASRVEGCGSCHDPHGSVNRHMLAYQNTADLCYSCHTDVPSFHAPPRFTSGTVCTNCHSAIHGSNLDPTFLK